MRVTLESIEGKVEKYLPTGPSIGVKGSWSPHKTRTGNEMLGINCTGFGPGGPVTMETKASRAPSSSAGSLIICSPVWKEAFWIYISRQLKKTWSIGNFHLPEPIRRPRIPYFHKQTVEYSSDYPWIGQKKRSIFALHGGLEETDFCSQKMYYFSLTRSKIAEAIPRCFNKKSMNQSSGKSSFILQSSTMALLFMPPAQFNRTSPRTRFFLDSDRQTSNTIFKNHEQITASIVPSY